MDDVLLVCRACNPVCSSCTSYAVCQGCQSVNGVGYFLNGVTCTVTCPSNKYGQTGDNFCVPCVPSCATCFGPSSTACLTCQNDGVNDNFLIYGTSICSLSCPDGQYQNATSFRCLLCSSYCKTCVTNSTNCLTCGITASGLELFLENG
jgi:hypothetical protein